ncbi:MAG: DNA-binding domain-containing protein, partial [Betaproteobacteria bacterium]
MNSAQQLALTEAHFQDHVLTGNPAIDCQIEGDSAELRNTRLGIYRDAYRLRLIEVLGNDYEVLHVYLGDDLFNALAGDYIDAHPSTFRNVRWFGGRLADFLRATPRYAEHQELAEIAQFEWSLGQAFDSPDEDAVRFEAVAAVAPEAWPELRFKSHPALRMLE